MTTRKYTEYATCDSCGYRKMCRMANGRFVCYACEHGNYNGLKEKEKRE